MKKLLKRFKKAGKGQKGFTLIEILIVVAIIIIIAALILPNVFGRQVKAKVARTIGDRYELVKAASLFYQDTAKWPAEAYGGNLTDDSKWKTLWIEGKDSGGSTITGADPPYLTKFTRNAAWSSSYYCWYEDDNGSAVVGNGSSWSWSDIAYLAIVSNAGAAIVPKAEAEKLDEEFDDGVYNTGMVRADASYTGTGNVKVAIFCFRK